MQFAEAKSRNQQLRSIMDNHPIDLFSGTIATLSRSLDLRARKHEMILNNVANADTPNYRPFAMNVEAALQKEPAGVTAGQLQTTDDQHLAGHSIADDPARAKAKTPENPLLFRGDRNGVDIDAEMTALAKNSLLYKASAQMIASKFKGIKNAITGGTK
jgi:flagellar basal-body rod protein FlgB